MFANRTGWFALPYMTKHNNEIHVFEINLFSTITRMHKHLILAVVYDIFLFYASIASNVTNDKPTGCHAARRPIVPPMPPFSNFILYEWICAITLLKITPFRHSCPILIVDFCRLFLLRSLCASSKTPHRVSRSFLFFASTFWATICIVSSLVSSYDGGFSRGRFAAGRSL